ncbi:hypothetical protein TTHERM_000125089 (macronuclear) [Tetrahymena thermophila SB210]|uniref:Uncharacterized protein n=1 Tax=Tetrahymena thermophila (strain SB210) TaxID=312017 RepID=W7XI64_TETTS|nr:hypothetical protein TTHERM_000125089 [Tetrahymena thermophila SB210]EWS74346.1 hypothetical protein TTHERM_000125089 [Tetrahymena thermophila SB210]|eukprot:XP_012653167.1 hypothetical protein TTHERM_000125089 [Tetrahymena thermophila SB210]
MLCYYFSAQKIQSLSICLQQQFQLKVYGFVLNIPLDFKIFLNLNLLDLIELRQEIDIKIKFTATRKLILKEYCHLHLFVKIQFQLQLTSCQMISTFQKNSDS